MSLTASHNQYVDFLRGVSIILVLLLHFALAYHLSDSILGTIFSKKVISSITRNGNYGVTMFFVISGFLITSKSIARYKQLGNVNMLQFYMMRFARIVPTLLLLLFILVILSLTPIAIFHNSTSSNVSTFTTVLSVLTFWHNVLMEKAGYFNYCMNILWSLSVEEVFYFAFPILCIIFKKERFILPIWIALIILGPIYRSFHTDDEIIALYGYWSCFDAIALGCCAALVAKKYSVTGNWRKLLSWFAIALIAVTYFYSGIMDNVVYGVSLVAIGTAILLVQTHNKERFKILSTNIIARVVCWFGKCSYELYLFHIIILALMKTIISREQLGAYTKVLWLLAFLIISSLLAEVISHFYTEPLNKKLRKLY
ncbi:MAG TPA: acyltransferase [Bacteroidia bacterium]|jgi:peptidoglycan/LPS O-acetylase OafA/YrhL|nr:acyltransferase [Bacteroidia bacterium]